jgi:hypothetical protein
MYCQRVERHNLKVDDLTKIEEGAGGNRLGQRTR